MMRRPLCLTVPLLLTALVLFGCTKPDKAASTEAEPAPMEIAGMVNLPAPTPQMLAALGAENDIPINRLLAKTTFVIAGKPKQFLASPLGKGNEDLVINVLMPRLQLQLFRFNPNAVERFVQSFAEPIQVPIQVPNQNDPNGPPQPGMMIVMRRAMILTFDKPLTWDDIFTGVFGGKPDAAKIDPHKRVSGKMEYYLLDNTPQNFSMPQKLGIGLLNERTLLLAEGPDEDVAGVFSDEPQNNAVRNAVLSRLKHTPVDASDLTILSSLEGMPLNVKTIEQTVSQLPFIPKMIAPQITQHLRAFTLSLQSSAAAGAPVITLNAEARSEDGGKPLCEGVQGVLLNARTTLATMTEEQKKTLGIPVEFANLLLESIKAEHNKGNASVVLKNSEKLIPTVAEMLHQQQNVLQMSRIQQAKINQMKQLHHACMLYYEKFQKFPADIVNAEGKPTLSWRVALLPVMGKEGEELYAKFKLDEPWDSETNKAVLGTMPQVYLPIAIPNTAPPKTVIHFFDSTGTPLSNRNLKKEDLKQPGTTLLYFSSAPPQAVEWTKPGAVPFDIATVKESVPDVLFGITFAGEIVAVPTLPETAPQFEQWKKVLNTLILGLPEEKPATPAEPPVNPQ